MLDIGAKIAQDKLKQAVPQYQEARRQMVESINYYVSESFIQQIVGRYGGQSIK